MDGGVISLSTTCRHCDEPDCLRACISGAIRKNDARGGPDRHRTVRRLLVLRHGLPLRGDPAQPARKKANKCDLCPDRETPACVAACPNRALVFKEGSQK